MIDGESALRYCGAAAPRWQHAGHANAPSTHRSPAASGKLLSREEIAESTRKKRAEILQRFPLSLLCQPIAAAPAHYGTSPMNMDLAQPYPTGT